MIREPFVRNPYNYDVDAASDESGLSCGEPSRTQQNMKKECDINYIMERFGKTGQLPANVRQPTFGDFTTALDFQQSMNAIRAASEEFMLLPAAVRKRFDNDPAKFIAFFEDDKNRDEAIELGFIPKPAPDPDPVKVRVISDTPPA